MRSSFAAHAALASPLAASPFSPPGLLQQACRIGELHIGFKGSARESAGSVSTASVPGAGSPCSMPLSPAGGIDTLRAPRATITPGAICCSSGCLRVRLSDAADPGTCTDGCAGESGCCGVWLAASNPAKIASASDTGKVSTPGDRATGQQANAAVGTWSAGG